jgi:hypothetical protein
VRRHASYSHQSCSADAAICTSYDVPHRIFSSEVYPCQASNGSTIIVYGHVDGLRILWRGGKPFKQSMSSKEKANRNGTTSKDSMVIDLDDDEAEPAQSTPQRAEFADEDEEIDPSEPYLQILRSINIPFGTAARHLAIPHMPSHVSQAPLGAYPPIYSTHIVLTVACDDLSVRLVSLPLTPPPQEATNPSAWGVQIVKIGPTSHQDLLSSIAITHTSLPLDSDDEMDKGKSRSRSGSRLGNTGATASNPNGGQQWRFLIASTSPTAGGLLLVHQLPSDSDATLSTLPESHVLFQRQYFRSPLISSMIRFNPSPYPADRHSNILVTFPDGGCVKIYQALPDSNSAYYKGRRGSAATMDSATSTSRSLPASANRPGKLLLTLYTGFIESSESVSSTRRKRVLDAAWMLGGRAVLVLLEDGEWGVWDVEGAGPPSASNKNLFRGQDSVCGIQGGALTRFSLNGFITPPADEAPKTQQAEAKDTKSGGLAPMTPQTRKLRSDGLFRGSASRDSSTAVPSRFIQGCIRVTEHQTANLSTTATPMSESILLSLGNINLWIPSLQALWRAESTGRGSLDSSGTLRPTPFTALQLGGEQQRSIAALPQPSNKTPSALFGPRRGRQTDILISTDNRLIMLVSPISEAQASAPTSQGAGDASVRADTDQLLLTQGDLDIDGMDRILDSMTNGNSQALARPGKSVGFDLDDDGDVVGMGTPTPKNNGRLALAGATPGATRSGKTRRELFT